MGSWGVKALESDNGLDLISLLKTDYLPKHKKLTLGGLIGFLKEEGFLGETVSEIDFLYDNTAIALAELYSEWRETVTIPLNTVNTIGLSKPIAS